MFSYFIGTSLKPLRYQAACSLVSLATIFPPSIFRGVPYGVCKTLMRPWVSEISIKDACSVILNSTIKISKSTSSNHNPAHSGSFKHSLCIFRCFNISVSNDRNVDSWFNFFNDIPINCLFIHLNSYYPLYPYSCIYLTTSG